MQNNSINAEELSCIWQAYSSELLQWKNNTEAQATDAAQSQNDTVNISRIVRMGEAKQVSHYVLLGVNAQYILELSEQLQNSNSYAQIVVVETTSVQAHFCQRFFIENNLVERVHLLYDSSPFALFMLSFALGLLPEKCSLIFCQPPQERSEALLTFRKLFLSSKWEELLPPTYNQTLSLHVIVHPNEPHLESFFAHIPAWIHEVLVLWDADAPVERVFACAAPVRHFAHPLQKDFSAQRNRLLAKSTGDFVLYLDADERLESSTWDALCHFLQDAYSGGVVFPRMTFERDSKHVRMGHGLWPDLQLRLFAHKQQQEIRFENTVHERLVGLSGSAVLAVHLPIWHYSHIFKTAQELEQRLAVFNAAGNFTHTLSAHYPSLPQKFFLQWQRNFKNNHIIRLP